MPEAMWINKTQPCLRITHSVMRDRRVERVNFSIMGVSSKHGRAEVREGILKAGTSMLVPGDMGEGKSAPVSSCCTSKGLEVKESLVSCHHSPFSEV